MFKVEAKLYDFFHGDKDYRKQAQTIRETYPQAKTILEIGSGTGMMTKELKKLGFKVTCLEPSLHMAAMSLEKKRINVRDLYPCTIQDFRLTEQYDLVLALYDVLNYVPVGDYHKVLHKIKSLGKNYIIELWPHQQKITPVVYKYVKGIHRIRLGFKVGPKVFLWYLFFGKTIVPIIEHHALYLHSHV